MFFSNVDDRDIKERIRVFRTDVEAGIGESEIVRSISSIFGDVFSFGTEARFYEKGTRFYRARSIPLDDTVIPLKTLRDVRDAWEPPLDCVRVQGRLNNVGQSILYCCPNDFELAIDEARARNSKYVAVMVYKAVRRIKVAVLGNYEESSLSKDDSTRMFYSFLDEEFSRLVSKGQEARYSITRAIADTYFNYPEQDAWCYRSVQSPLKFNVAFLPNKSKVNLELIGAMICEPSKNSSGSLCVKLVVEFDSKSGSALYHSIGSHEQNKIFPEITTSKI
ncbi:RES family NAD+ phosphorylase [Pseudomonas sp. CFBP 13602]|uniref:RES family NAD+ phosphorylase n=1 Tax=Pseudomonas sp. CFBP 13602 TaxID=2774039 RepID=UPI0017820076|nr:RES family NAD+ phosphorylase [Pseudomonas sp. CFBP 13602]MBD8826710.1 RES domain-containing protein [Pseudomonas sp. CFBP 13602]